MNPTSENTVLQTRVGNVAIISINRPSVRNAVDRPTAAALADAFRSFDADSDLDVAVLTGVGGSFCAGADLNGVAAGKGNQVDADINTDGPMGPTRMLLTKPVIAAIEGYAVAGGLELAAWCDLRVMADDAVIGVFCRRWGVPLIDGGTIRLTRLLGQSRAMDLVLTGRAVGADEAETMGFANRVVPTGMALAAAVKLAQEIAAFPQNCVKSDRRSMYDQWHRDERDALSNETRLGLETIRSGETQAGAARFANGAGRHGSPL